MYRDIFNRPIKEGSLILQGARSGMHGLMRVGIILKEDVSSSHQYDSPDRVRALCAYTWNEKKISLCKRPGDILASSIVVVDESIIPRDLAKVLQAAYKGCKKG